MSTSRKNTKIDDLRANFNAMSAVEKNNFIEKLRAKLQGINNTEYRNFLNECIRIYNAETQGGSQTPSVDFDIGDIPNVAPRKQKKSLKGIVVALSAVAVVTFIFVAGIAVWTILNMGTQGGTSITGTWELSSDFDPWIDSSMVPSTTIEFRGNRFTATSYAFRFNRHTTPTINQRVRVIFGDNQDRFDSMELIGTARIFLEYLPIYLIVISGTYSLSESGDRMEFIFSNGDIAVVNFSRTENTITIGSQLFVRG